MKMKYTADQSSRDVCIPSDHSTIETYPGLFTACHPGVRAVLRAARGRRQRSLDPVVLRRALFLAIDLSPKFKQASRLHCLFFYTVMGAL